MGKKMLFLVVLMAVCFCSSVALGGGPLGPPMSLLDHGQWAFDVGYYYEDMDLHGCYDWTEVGQYYYYGWYDYYGMGAGKIVMKNFKTNTWMGSIEYGLCDNWDIFLRLGMADAQADVEYRGVYAWYDEFYDEEYCGPDYWEEDVDFGYGFAWQFGTAFTICESGPWTFGGRMQAGFAYPDKWDYSDSYEDMYGYEEHKGSMDLEWWEALGYVGANYQLDDGLLVYGAGGWQTLHAEIEEKWSGYEVYDYYYYYEEEYEYEGTDKIRHASPIGVFGVSWAPNDDYNVAVDCLVGEAGKFGLSVYGLIMF